MTYEEAQAEAVLRWGAGCRAALVRGDKAKQCRIVFLLHGRKRDVLPLGVAANWKSAFRKAERFIEKNEEMLKALLKTTKQEREEMKRELQSGDVGGASGQGPGGEVPPDRHGSLQLLHRRLGKLDEGREEAGED